MAAEFRGACHIARRPQVGNRGTRCKGRGRGADRPFGWRDAGQAVGDRTGTVVDVIGGLRGWAALAMLDVEPGLAAARPNLILITDKGFADRLTEADLACCGITLLRPSRKDETARHGEPLLKTIRRSSNRSTTPSKASSTSKPTAAAPSKASPSASPSASWQWLPPSGTTTRRASPSPRSLIAYDHSLQLSQLRAAQRELSGISAGNRTNFTGGVEDKTVAAVRPPYP
jgi:hypothetical protein